MPDGEGREGHLIARQDREAPTVEIAGVFRTELTVAFNEWLSGGDAPAASAFTATADSDFLRGDYGDDDLYGCAGGDTYGNIENIVGSDAAGATIIHEPDNTAHTIQVFWDFNRPRQYVSGATQGYRVSLRVRTSGAAATTCTIAGGGFTTNLNCPSGTSLVLSGSGTPLLVGGTGPDKDYVPWGREISISAVARNSGVVTGRAITLHGMNIGGPNMPTVSASPAAGGVWLFWEGGISSPQSGPVVNGFRVEHQEFGATDWTESAVLDASAGDYTLTGLDFSKNYEILVRARNDAGDSNTGTNWWGVPHPLTIGNQQDTAPQNSLPQVYGGPAKTELRTFRWEFVIY